MHISYLFSEIYLLICTLVTLTVASRGMNYMSSLIHVNQIYGALDVHPVRIALFWVFGINSDQATTLPKTLIDS